MAEDINHLLKHNHSTIIVMHSEDYIKRTIDILRFLGQLDQKVGYVNLNKLISRIRSLINSNGSNMDNFYFVDGVTKSVISSPELYNNCIYVPSPKDLTKMNIAITKMLKIFGPYYVFFDSISSLLIYESTEVSSQFLHTLVNKINAYGSKIVFTCLTGEKEDLVIKNLSLVIDKIYRA